MCFTNAPSSGPKPHTLPTTNAYYCCNCGYGPMLYVLHPACIMCGDAACGRCQGTTIPEDTAHSSTRVAEAEPTPRDPYGAVFDSSTAAGQAMMLRYLHDDPCVTERLAYGTERASITKAEAELDQLMRDHGYNMRVGEQRL